MGWNWSGTVHLGFVCTHDLFSYVDQKEMMIDFSSPSFVKQIL